MKLDLKSLSISLSIIAFGLVMILGLWFSATGFGKPVIDMISSIYANIVKLSYNPLVSFAINLSSNAVSILILSLFSAVDGIILGFVLGTIYNSSLPKDKK